MPYVFTDRVVGEVEAQRERDLQLSATTAAHLRDPALGRGRAETRRSRRGPRRARRPPDADARLAARRARKTSRPKKRRCGSSAPRAARCCTGKIWKPTFRCATSATHHFRMHAYDRINTLVDGDFVEIGADILPGDPLEWVDKRPYPAKARSGPREIEALAKRSLPASQRSTVFRSRWASWISTSAAARWAPSSASGSRTCSRKRRRRRLPCVIFTASGGARMEEGMLALDADGEDDASGRTLHGRRQSVHHRADRSDDRRRVGVVRVSEPT